MVRIITDSSCDLTPEQAARLNVHVVALGVTFEDGPSYRDRVALSPEEFYRKLAACDKLPTTCLLYTSRRCFCNGKSFERCV